MEIPIGLRLGTVDLSILQIAILKCMVICYIDRMLNELEIASVIHCMSLEALLCSRSWKPDEMAFQGGTSLHLMRQSPRFSEDLDFMVALDDQAVRRLMAAICRHVSSMAQLEWPDAVIDCQYRIPDQQVTRVASLRLKCKHPDVPCKVTVRIEMLRLAPDQLADYVTEPMSVVAPRKMRTSITAIIRTGTIASIYVDKLTALPLRSYLKCRDIFGLWWIWQNHKPVFLVKDHLVTSLRRNLGIYNTSDSHWCNQVDALIEQRLMPTTIHDFLGQELQRFLPAAYFQQLRDLVGFDTLIHTTVLALREASLAMGRPPGNGKDPN